MIFTMVYIKDLDVRATYVLANSIESSNWQKKKKGKCRQYLVLLQAARNQPSTRYMTTPLGPATPIRLKQQRNDGAYQIFFFLHKLFSHP
jgi:hypothetical protein